MNSTSLKILWFILPLLLVAVFVVINNPQGSTFWLSTYSHHHYYLETLNNGASTMENQKDEVPVNVTKSTTIPKRYSIIEKLEEGLARSRAAILLLRENKNVTNNNNNNNQKEEDDDEYIPHGPMYLNATAFHRSYLEMEKKLKVYVYKEGEPPVYHFGPCKHTYAIEGYFIQAMEVSKFRTQDPNKAHVYFLPLSITMLIQFIYVADSHEWGLMKNTAMDYVNVISQKYPYWNRSLGADHFMLACHDWGPEISFAIPHLYKNSIRALCNANTSEKFNPTKDVSIPEIHLPLGTTKGLLGGPAPFDRPILVFFAGGVHGPIRPILLQHWENSTHEDVQIHKYLPKGVSYYDMIRKSKYCICPSGYEVASPRMVEGLYMGCVPVLIKDNYVTPFSDVLNWDTFSVTIPVKDIVNLNKILMDIPQDKYLEMQKRGIQMRRHFEVNSPPKKYDVFHMILHSIWLRRLNFRVHDVNES
ncbi:putative glycosyltransferase [Capsicum annuum]|nr:probable glycosyltransferase At5g03795 [Capsicum annuum]KAF3659655.1 putative glycosyltransferase [Capsicum annuum]KAF3682550.1 putative glycosyltransferase [Capsicum annuum]